MNVRIRRRIGRRNGRRGWNTFILTPQAASHADSGRIRAQKVFVVGDVGWGVFAWKGACM
jgi:hypothetical protein